MAFQICRRPLGYTSDSDARWARLPPATSSTVGSPCRSCWPASWAGPAIASSWTPSCAVTASRASGCGWSVTGRSSRSARCRPPAELAGDYAERACDALAELGAVAEPAARWSCSRARRWIDAPSQIDGSANLRRSRRWRTSRPGGPTPPAMPGWSGWSVPRWPIRTPDCSGWLARLAGARRWAGSPGCTAATTSTGSWTRWPSRTGRSRPAGCRPGWRWPHARGRRGRWPALGLLLQLRAVFLGGRALVCRHGVQQGVQGSGPAGNAVRGR